MITEQWRTIPDYPRYEISNTGHVRDTLRNRLLRFNKGTCTLVNGTNRRRIRVHVIVANVFHAPGVGHIVRFKDGNPDNRRIDNLYRMNIINIAYIRELPQPIINKRTGISV